MRSKLLEGYWGHTRPIGLDPYATWGNQPGLHDCPLCTSHNARVVSQAEGAKAGHCDSPESGSIQAEESQNLSDRNHIISFINIYHIESCHIKPLSIICLSDACQRKRVRPCLYLNSITYGKARKDREKTTTVLSSAVAQGQCPTTTLVCLWILSPGDNLKAFEKIAKKKKYLRFWHVSTHGLIFNFPQPPFNRATRSPHWSARGWKPTCLALLWEGQTSESADVPRWISNGMWLAIMRKRKKNWQTELM